MNAVAEFFHMGGYAFYVWTSYGLMAIVLLANWAGPIRRHRRVRRELRRRAALARGSGNA